METNAAFVISFADDIAQSDRSSVNEETRSTMNRFVGTVHVKEAPLLKTSNFVIAID